MYRCPAHRLSIRKIHKVVSNWPIVSLFHHRVERYADTRWNAGKFSNWMFGCDTCQDAYALESFFQTNHRNCIYAYSRNSEPWPPAIGEYDEDSFKDIQTLTVGNAVGSKGIQRNPEISAVWQYCVLWVTLLQQHARSRLHDPAKMPVAVHIFFCKFRLTCNHYTILYWVYGNCRPNHKEMA